MKLARKLVHFGLPLLGAAIAVLGAALVSELVVRVLAVLVGLVLVQAPTWKVPYSLLHNERRFRQLRGELDQFVWLTRELNAAAVAARGDPVAEDRFEDLHTAMQESLERMAMYAGRTDEELLREPELQPR